MSINKKKTNSNISHVNSLWNSRIFCVFFLFAINLGPNQEFKTNYVSTLDRRRKRKIESEIDKRRNDDSYVQLMFTIQFRLESIESLDYEIIALAS